MCTLLYKEILNDEGTPAYFLSYPLLRLAEVDLKLEEVWKFECCIIDHQTQVRKSNLDSVDGFYFLFNYLTLLSNTKYAQL